MTNKSHITLGFCSAFAVGINTSAPLHEVLMFSALSALASLLPDTMEIVGRHRSFTHLVYWIPVMLVLTVYLAYYTKYAIFAGLPFGYMIHLLCDSLSLSGIPWGYKSRHLKFKLYKTSCFSEYIVVTFAVIILFCWAWPPLIKLFAK